MKRGLLTYLLVLFAITGTAQELQLKLSLNDNISGAVVDSIPLKIYNSSNQMIFQDIYLNESVLTLETKQTKWLKIVVANNPIYKLDTTVVLPKFNKVKGAVSLNLKLHYLGQMTHGVEVYGYYRPNIIFSSEQESISDYVVINRDTLVALVYPQRLKKYSELLLYVSDSVIVRKPIPGTARSLYSDFRNRLFLRLEDEDYLITDIAKLSLSKVSRFDLEQYITPVIDTFENESLYFSNYNSVYPAFDFFKINLKDTSQILVHHIEDREMMEHYRAEYKWADVRTKLWAWDKEDETGIDRKIWVGATVFANTIYYEEPFGNLFLVDSTAYVFDFYADMIYSYDAKTGDKIDSVQVEFHQNRRKNGWTKLLIQDPITKKVYTTFDDKGYTDVFEVSLTDGQLIEKFTLFYRYIENIQVVDNQVYYIYRPFESIQKKYLYQEDLLNKKRNLIGQNRFTN